MLIESVKPEHTRAARGWLDWTGPNLAEKARVYHQTVYNFERGKNITKENLEKIVNAFYQAGIIINDNGIQVLDNVREFKGKTGFIAFKNDVLWTVKCGGKVYVSDVDESLFEQWSGDQVAQYREEMKSIENLDFRILIGKGDRNTAASGYASYREDISEHFRPDVPMYIYGDKTANIVFKQQSVEVIIVNNKTLAEVNRDRFLRRWERATLLE